MSENEVLKAIQDYKQTGALSSIAQFRTLLNKVILAVMTRREWKDPERLTLQLQAVLSSLLISPGVLSPAFMCERLEYIARVLALALDYRLLHDELPGDEWLCVESDTSRGEQLPRMLLVYLTEFLKLRDFMEFKGAVKLEF